MREHPELKFNIDFSDRQIDLVEKGVDLAFRIADLEDSSLQARRICPVWWQTTVISWWSGSERIPIGINLQPRPQRSFQTRIKR